MPFELLVALRYLREGRAQTWLILTGVAVGVGVIIYLSALITGLQKCLIDRTLGTQAHVVVRPPEDLPRLLPSRETVLRAPLIERPAQRIRSILQWQRTIADIAGLPGVTAVAPTVAGPAMAVRGDGASSVAVRGVDVSSYRDIIDLTAFLTAGRLDLDGFHAVIGTELARYLGLGVGDRMRLRVGTDVGGVYTITGILDLGNKELNQRWVFVSLRAAQTMFGLAGGVSTIEVRCARIYDAEALARSISANTGLVADSWMRTNEQLLIGLRSQSASSRLIQTFVILAVALGIASVLAVSVVQKSREIGILRATGTRRAQVLRIFLLQGAILGLIGSLGGILLGSALARVFAGIARNPDGSPTFPVALTAALYLRSAAIALVVGVGSALLPARRAARMRPAEIIRYG
jgi:lipoprotein-releasing system permease protein